MDVAFLKNYSNKQISLKTQIKHLIVIFLNCVFKWHILKLLFLYKKNANFLNN